MANPEHLKILKQGVKMWNRWRDDNSDIVPNLSDTDLSYAELLNADLRTANLFKADLSCADLRNTKLINANLHNTKLINACLSYADLRDADLRDADLFKADLLFANFINADLRNANLFNAKLFMADLSTAKLTNAKLSYADLRAAKLNHADLSHVDLSHADISHADLSYTKLINADLRNTFLLDVNFNKAALKDTKFNDARVGNIVFANTDLSKAVGLETVSHHAPSEVGLSSIYLSQGQIPEVFLRGCGVPDDFITFIPSHFGIQQAIQFYSCFISYSTKDEEFAGRLYSRMRDEKLRVWFAPEDIQGGRKLHEQIERAIQIHDRLLIVLSENSMQSEWVMTEIRRARKTEIEENRRKLFPIRLVDFDAIRHWKCFDADTGKDLAIEVREYYIPNFSNWKDHDAFEKAFDRLLRDLKASE